MITERLAGRLEGKPLLEVYFVKVFSIAILYTFVLVNCAVPSWATGLVERVCEVWYLPGTPLWVRRNDNQL